MNVRFFMTLAICAAAMGQSVFADPIWVEQGPAPKIGGQSVGLTAQNNPVYGAVERIAASPTDPNLLLVGSVNGGVWRTTNALTANPVWTPVTDFLPSLSVGALSFDRANSNTVFLGVGKYSAMASSGGARTGLYKSTDAGLTWTAVAGNSDFAGSNISSVVANGSTVLVSVDAADTAGYNAMGLWRSTDGGATFTHQMWNNVTNNPSYPNLANQKGTQIVADPSNANRYYLAAHSGYSTYASGRGIYRSDDGGLTWTQLHDTALDSVTAAGMGNMKLSVNNNGTLFVGIVDSTGRCDGVFRTTNQGASFTSFGAPTTVDGSPGNTVINGIHPGGQGGIHFSLLADPTNDNVVYIGGDRQPLYTEVNNVSAVGATQYSGRLFRSSGAGSWSPLTDIGTASLTGPHADSRVMAFDANGNIIEGDDGGLYRRTSPSNTSGDWAGLGSTGATGLRAMEVHSVAYDNHGGVCIAGTQDNGSPMQSAHNSFTWTEAGGGGDGGVVAVYDRPGYLSYRYASSQYLGGFNYRTFGSTGTQLGSTVYPALKVNGSAGNLALKNFDPEAFGGDGEDGDPSKAAVPDGTFDQPPGVPFYTKFATNKVDSSRLIIGTRSIYETSDNGASLNVLGGINSGTNTPNVILASTVNAIAYGGFKDNTGYADVLYTGAGTELRIRPAGAGFSVLPTVDVTYNTAAGSSGFAITDVVEDFNNWDTAFVANSAERVFITTDAGASWSEIPGLSSLIGNELETLEFVRRGNTRAVFAGGLNGVFYAEDLGAGFGAWTEFGAGTLPNAKVTDLDYDPYADVLAVGLLGRGVWTVENASSFLDAVPEPASLSVLGLSGIALLLRRRRR